MTARDLQGDLPKQAYWINLQLMLPVFFVKPRLATAALQPASLWTAWLPSSRRRRGWKPAGEEPSPGWPERPVVPGLPDNLRLGHAAPTQPALHKPEGLACVSEGLHPTRAHKPCASRPPPAPGTTADQLNFSSGGGMSKESHTFALQCMLCPSGKSLG